MSDSSAQTIKGIISALKAQTPVTNIVGQRIFTQVPQNEVFPYIAISMRGTDFSAKDFSAMEHRLNVTAFSRSSSPKEALDIREAVYNALNRQENSVIITGFSLVSLQQEGVSDFFLDPDDGKTWTSILEFRVVVM